MFHGVLAPVCQIPLLERQDFAVAFKTHLQSKVKDLMVESMHKWMHHYSAHSKKYRGEDFMLDVLSNSIGTNMRRDPALAIVRGKWEAANIGPWGR